MTEHEPECPISIGSIEVVIDGKPATTVQYCGCSMLRLCERRVREDERSNNFTPDDFSDAMTQAYQRGLDAAREAVLGAKAVDVANGREWDEPAQFIWLNHALEAIDALKEKR